MLLMSWFSIIFLPKRKKKNRVYVLHQWFLMGKKEAVFRIKEWGRGGGTEGWLDILHADIGSERPHLAYSFTNIKIKVIDCLLSHKLTFDNFTAVTSNETICINNFFYLKTAHAVYWCSCCKLVKFNLFICYHCGILKRNGPLYWFRGTFLVVFKTLPHSFDIASIHAMSIVVSNCIILAS